MFINFCSKRNCSVKTLYQTNYMWYVFFLTTFDWYESQISILAAILAASVKQHIVAYSEYDDEPSLTTSPPVFSNLSQRADAKEDYSVHSAIFVSAHTALGGSGRGSCVSSGFLCRRGPRAQGPHCDSHGLHAVTAGGGHTNTVQCGKKMK